MSTTEEDIARERSQAEAIMQPRILQRVQDLAPDLYARAEAEVRAELYLERAMYLEERFADELAADNSGETPTDRGSDDGELPDSRDEGEAQQGDDSP